MLGPWEGIRPDGTGSEQMVVKLDGFGFGKWHSYKEKEQRQNSSSSSASFGLLSSDAKLELGKREDLQATALLLAEAFVCG